MNDAAPYYALKAQRYASQYIDQAGDRVTVRRIVAGANVDQVLTCMDQPLNARQVLEMQAQGLLNVKDGVPTCLVFKGADDVRAGDKIFVPQDDGTETLFRVGHVAPLAGGGGCIIKKNVLVTREGSGLAPITPAEDSTVADTPVDLVFVKGEKVPIYASDSVTQGSITISGQPTFTLRDSTNTPVTGFNGVSVTAYDTTTGTLVQAYFNFDTTNLPAGGYTGEIWIPITASDDIAREKTVKYDIYIREA